MNICTHVGNGDVVLNFRFRTKFESNKVYQLYGIVFWVDDIPFHTIFFLLISVFINFCVFQDYPYDG